MGHYYCEVAGDAPRAQKCYQRALALDPLQAGAGDALVGALPPLVRLPSRCAPSAPSGAENGSDGVTAPLQEASLMDWRGQGMFIIGARSLHGHGGTSQ